MFPQSDFSRPASLKKMSSWFNRRMQIYILRVKYFVYTLWYFVLEKNNKELYKY